MTPRPLPRAVPPRDLSSLKRAICARARDFEIAPLLDLLATMGYRPDEVCFRGHVTETPQPTLLHHIEFADADGTIAGPADPTGRSVDLGSIAELAAEAPAPRPHQPSQVTVTVNLGLLSCRSPLPSYFQHLLRDDLLHEPLVELLQIIDRSLLRARLTCDRPERIVERWDEITSDLLRIHSLDSLVGLSWLFRHVFPELPAQVKRTSEQLRVPYASALLGGSDLGSACLGPVTRIDVHDFQVTLYCEETLLRPGVPWLQETDRRLRAVVFPALEPVCMNLTVVLELRDDFAVAVLSDEDGPLRDSYLGMDPLGPPAARRRPPRRVVLYSGLLPHDQADTDELELALAAQAQPKLTGRVPTAPGGSDTEDTLFSSRPSSGGDGDGELELTIELGGRVHRYQATVRWGVRAWFRDEPYAIELRCEHLIQVAPTPGHHPQLWSWLRDHARQALAAELAAATLKRYRAAAVTDEIVKDLLENHQDAALHALLDLGRASDVPREAWDRYLRAQP